MRWNDDVKMTGNVLTFCVDPIRIHVRQGRLIAHMFDRLRGLLIYQATGTPPPALFAVIHLGFGRGPQ